ncbi:MAG TPA: hypothetical protein VGH98_01025 [Gemmatimonadaceae bacterium]|jgi:hypothetical protein
MSTGNEKRQRKRSTRVRRTDVTPPKRDATFESDHSPTDVAAREHYRREKARRAERVRPAEHPLEQARRAYHALLAADAERAKGGRPKKPVISPKQKTAESDQSAAEPEQE